MKTRLVVKLIAVLVLLLVVVLYKMNDFYKQEKLSQAEAQVRKQIVAVKTSVSSQISTVKNVVSSYNTEIKESAINWVQLDPFFAIAHVQKKNDGSLSVINYVGRSGTMGEKWNKAYLEKALAVRKSKSDKSIQARIFKDRAGGKYLTLIFPASGQVQTAVVGQADYFQKYFDMDRGGRMTSALMTADHMLAGHSESDYIATISEEDQLPEAKYIFEKEEIAGTNLIAISYALKKTVAAAWMVPWSVVGLILGFGFVLIALLYVGLDPLDKKIERYKKQERETLFKDMVQQEVQSNNQQKPEVIAAAAAAQTKLIENTRQASIEEVQKSFAEPAGELAESTINAPLQQALFNLDSVFRQSQIEVTRDITTRLTHSFFYGAFIKSFENILRNAIEAVSEQTTKKIVIRAYDIENTTVIEIQDSGIGLKHLQKNIENVWQPFFTTKSKTQHMGLGLTEALSTFRRCGGDLSIEPLAQGVVVKMIIKKEHIEATEALEKTVSLFENEKASAETQFQADLNFASVPAAESCELDLDEVLSLDEVETENIFLPQKIKLVKSEVAESKPVTAPHFALSKKTYLVDKLPVTIRRPEKS